MDLQKRSGFDVVSLVDMFDRLDMFDLPELLHKAESHSDQKVSSLDSMATGPKYIISTYHGYLMAVSYRSSSQASGIVFILGSCTVFCLANVWHWWSTRHDIVQALSIKLNLAKWSRINFLLNNTKSK